MAFEPGGIADKLGNRYEGRWVARQLLRLLNEEIQFVAVELIGPDEYGVDLRVIEKDGTRQLQQCKARFSRYKSLTIAALRTKGILEYLKCHLSRDSKQEFVLVSAIPGRALADICDSARNSNDNPNDFFQYQIQEVGKERRTIFHDFCDALELDPNKEDELKTAFDYLKRTYIEFYPDSRETKNDLLTRAGFLLTGEPETAISVLLTYTQDDKYRRPIYADELRRYLADKYKIYPKHLEHDQRLVPAVEELIEQFSESIRPKLIGGKIIPREETSKIIESIDKGQDVVVHGTAGNGKSGVLYELVGYLNKKNIPYIPIRLDRRIPNKNAKQFGEDLGLPDSPAFSLNGLVGDDRKGVLILDQLDAVRWTAAHSSVAMDVCWELLRQIRSLRRSEKKITIVFACRTFDLENDPEIKSLVEETREQSLIKIPIKEFTDEQLEKIIGSDFTSLTNAQKRILSCAQNLAIWITLKMDGTLPEFRSTTELMRRFWENRRKVLKQEAEIYPEQMDAFLKPLLDYMENNGAISAPTSIVAHNPSTRDALISFGILQKSANRISFCHQRYLDHLIAERLLQKIYQSNGSVIDWLGTKSTQSLFRREQLRQVLTMLSDETPIKFYNTVRELLESSDVRFHLKHLILELVGQLSRITGNIGSHFLGLFNDEYWSEHIQKTVFVGHQPWLSYLLAEGVIQELLDSSDEQRSNRALWLLHSVSENVPDQVADILTPYLDESGDWSERILNTICWKEVDDSKRMFELRLKLAKKGRMKDFIAWESLSVKYPLRAIQLLEAILSTWNAKDEEVKTHKRTWYDQELNTLRSAVKQHPIKTWDLLMPHIVRLTNIRIDNYEVRLAMWEDNRLFRIEETSFAREVLGLVKLAGRTLAFSQPARLISRIHSLNQSTSSVIQELIIESYAHLPAGYADTGIDWMLGNSSRFRLGSGYLEPEWNPAIRLIKALSPHSSNKSFQRLEDTIIHYHAPDEKQNAKDDLKGWHDGYFYHYWGRTQYLLLPALDAQRIQPSTADLIRVLNRKFEDYPKDRFLKGGASSGGMIGSKLDPNLDKISDKAWLRIVTSKKIPEQNIHNWIQIDPGHVLTTSISQFASSLSRITKRYPERFGQLVLQFPDNVHAKYVSSILSGLRERQPGTEVPEPEKDAWKPARVETIEDVLDKYESGDDQESAMSFCRLIADRADENWSDKTIARLVDYACDHPDPETGKLHIHCNVNCEKASVEILFQNTINCVRGVAAGAIGRLLWVNKDRLEQVKTGIESLVSDPHPAVRMAAIEAIMPVLNIDKDLAVQWFCNACKDDLRVPASPRVLPFFNHTVPSHVNQVGPIIKQMVLSPQDDVSKEGAKQVTARQLFHGLFEKEFVRCLKGTVLQRMGVANAVVSLLYNSNYSGKCQELLWQFMNDPEKDVRDELRGVFRNSSLLEELQSVELVKEYIRSNTFADDPSNFIMYLKDFTGSLIPLADVVFVICDEFSTTLKDKTSDNSSRYSYLVSEISSILLRLYEQAQGEQSLQLASHCLDIWDIFFENRIGRSVELTKAIEK